MKRFLWFFIGLAVALPIAMKYLGSGGGSGNGAATGAAFFSASYSDTGGRPVSFESFRNRPVAVVFWATWCQPCVREIPDLTALYNEYRGQGLVIVGITDNTDSAELARFVQAKAMSYPVFQVDPATLGSLARETGNRKGAIPFMVLIDRTGRIVETRAGRSDREDLRAAFMKIL